MRFALACLLGLAACDGAPGSQVAWNNEGQLCLDAGPPVATDSGTTTASTPTTTTTTDAGTGDSGDAVPSVTFGGCDCGDDTEASCAATRDGDVWSVTSEATSYTGCEPCEPVVATCDLGVLASGTHTFEHGGDLMVVEVPGELKPSCIGETSNGTKL